MATLISAIRDQARAVPLMETSASFWTDAELLDIAIAGIKDLWGAIIDLYADHFQTIDVTNVSIAAATETLTGVPADCFRVMIIEPRDTTSASSQRGLLFMPAKYNSKEFIAARTMDNQDPTIGGSNVIYYSISQAGFPVAAPTITIAPKLTAAVLLRFVYVPGLGTLTAASNNPIPGESDLAVKAWIVAHARSKEREDRSPDPNWLAVYATEKSNILTRLTPRQTQEPEVVEGMFEDNA